MSKQTDRAYAKGQDDFDNGNFSPPSRDPLTSLADTMFGSTTADQRDSAYRAGHSDAGRNK